MRKIGIIGSGNMAYHLALRLKEKGFSITQIFNRTELNAKQICSITGATYISDISSFMFEENDVNIISVSDDALKLILKDIYIHSSLLLHTSGSLSIQTLKDYSKNYGVIYPLQSINKDKIVDFSLIPFLVEANNENNLLKIKDIAGTLSNKVVSCDSQQREMVHIAAVFVSNFTNYLYSIGYDLMRNSGLDFSILKPLITETALRLETHSPQQLQTGPARRGDVNIINNHLERLSKFKEYQNLYNILSKEILNQNAENIQ